jgi:hypothetical protein
MEQALGNLIFGWFLGRSMDDTVWVSTVFTKNRERLIEVDAVIGPIRQGMWRCLSKVD